MMTVREVAERWRVCERFVLRAIHAGRLEAMKIGREYRVWPDAVEAFEEAARIRQKYRRVR